MKKSVTPKELPLVTPGEILLKEFLKPKKLSALALAKQSGIPLADVKQILKGRKAIDGPIAKRLAEFFKMSAAFWTNLQKDFDERKR